MAFKDILVHIDYSKNVITRLKAATSLAQSHNAQLTGLYMLPSYELGLLTADYVTPELLEASRNAAQARAQEQEAMFRTVTAESQLQARWRCVEGEPARQFILQARCHDLAIIGQADPEDPRALNGGFINQVLLGAGRPVLVIPYIGFTTPLLGRHVVIAWNGGREAVRAVHDALPLLAAAQRVTVLTIHTAGSAPLEALSAAELCEHLARHGIAAVAANISASDIEVGDMLLSRAADESADLIVMGAYGHSRLREIVMGGATRHLLKHMTVPVLMSH